LALGGRLVYSTCSISALENDGVIEKLLKSRKGSVRVVPLGEDFGGEPTVYGRAILPDVGGCGPIYYGALEKF
jgi:16S rRNA C967 or C1407 C5-methylase (RsmB/RsmF family)